MKDWKQKAKAKTFNENKRNIKKSTKKGTLVNNNKTNIQAIIIESTKDKIIYFTKKDKKYIPSVNPIIFIPSLAFVSFSRTIRYTYIPKLLI